ncbi:MAG: type II and III secretion system protein family protein [Pseudomonadota bacterium]|nr:type II and III secretion system protein family protein [Pseudomonadota bacterium]
MSETKNRSSLRRHATAALAIAAIALCTIPAHHSWASKSTLLEEKTEAPKDPTVEIALGKGEVIKLDGAVADIHVGNASIANVEAIQANALYVLGRNVGDTNVIALDSEGNVIKRINIHVHFNTEKIEETIYKFFPDETDVKVRAVGTRFIITGRVPNPSIAQQIEDLVTAHAVDVRDKEGTADETIVNMLSVTGEQQVMLNVKIVEINRTILKELGLETSINGFNPTGQQSFNVLPPNSFDDNGYIQNLINSATGLSEDPFTRAALAVDPGIAGLGLIEFALSALERQGLSNTLAEPNLTAISGEQAGFLAGGEFPVPTGRDRNGNITIEYRAFGVSLNFVPTVVTDDRISLQLNTEVSSLDFNQGITISEVSVPGLDVRRASTTIEMGSGSSLMIAGLMKSEAVKNLAGVPGIKDTPVLGDLVSSHSFTREETELLVIVTPMLVQPYAENRHILRKDKAPETHQLAMTFAKNIRRIYGTKAPEMNEKGDTFGYIID